MLLRLSSAYVAAAAVHVAVELRIADRLAAGPRTAAALAAETGVSEDGLYRTLRALASVGVFQERRGGVFASTTASVLLRDTPGSLRAIIRWMTGPPQFRIFADLAEAVRTGEPVTARVFGQPLFESLAVNPDLLEGFSDAMTAMSVPVTEAIVSACAVGDARIVVDVGGGHGFLLASILRRRPEVRGILFDREQVVAGAGPLMTAAGVAERCTCVGGDFFAEVPRGGDIYLLKHVLHDWPDEPAIAIARTVRAAMADRATARLIVVEAVLEDQGADFGKFLDLTMLALVGGRERTAGEFGTLLTRAGFDLVRLTRTRSPLTIIEATPSANRS